MILSYFCFLAPTTRRFAKINDHRADLQKEMETSAFCRLAKKFSRRPHVTGHVTNSCDNLFSGCQAVRLIIKAQKVHTITYDPNDHCANASTPVDDLGVIASGDAAIEGALENNAFGSAAPRVISPTRIHDDAVEQPHDDLSRALFNKEW